MIVERLELVDFRNYAHAVFELTAGTTAVLGDNGQGKTNFAEALAYLATLASFRAAPPRRWSASAPTRPSCAPTVRDDEVAASLIEAELSRPAAIVCRSTVNAWPVPAICSVSCGSVCSRRTI